MSQFQAAQRLAPKHNKTHFCHCQWHQMPHPSVWHQEHWNVCEIDTYVAPNTT
ncbi:uncharacterized protein DS421_20g701160 [Arachis hypogaea]|nr:uncharacterized protein DS421_20g701160 [Arachis hypogaea]